MKVRLDTPETEDWIKPPVERAKSANRKRLRSGGDPDGTGSPSPSGRRLSKHAYKGSQTHSTGTGQEVHGSGGGGKKTLYRGEGTHERESYYTTTSGMAGGWWTDDPEKARRYALGTEDGKVYQIEVDEGEYERRGLEYFITDPEVRERRHLMGATKTLYHLTDNPKFNPDPNIDPPENALSIMSDNRKGIYLTESPEHWINRYDYVRPFVAEVEVDEGVLSLASTPGGAQVFLPAEDFGSMKMKRLMPIDEYAREEYGDYGWVETYYDEIGEGKFHEGEGGFGPDAKPWVPAPFGHDYRYEGPDVRDMTVEETDRLAARVKQYLIESRGFTEEDFAKHAYKGSSTHSTGTGQEVHGVKTSSLKPQQSMEETLSGRTHGERQALTDSIKAEGIKEPLLLDKDYTIADGHQRHIIAQNLGIEEVPAVFTSEPEFDIRANRDLRMKLSDEYRSLDDQSTPEAKKLVHDVWELDRQADAYRESNTPDPEPEDYRGQHQPTATYGAHLNDLSELVQEDIYAHPEWYGVDSPHDWESWAVVSSVRDNPDARVTIYRAVPDTATEINPGDWVTLSRSYAEMHAESNLGGYTDIAGEWHPNPGTILERTARAGDIIWPGDDINEYGWFPDEIQKRKTNRTPGFPHGPSIKWPKVYQALRRDGKSKSDAAAISNAHWNKYRRWGKAGDPGPKSAADYEEKRGRKARRRKGIPLPKSRQKSIVKHPWQGSEIHSTGTDQSVHGTGQVTGPHPDPDTPYEHATTHADDLFDMDVILNGERYHIDGTEAEFEDLMVKGDLFNPEGEDVGDFVWTADDEYPEWVKLELVTIDASERASGLGLTVIREWERRLGEVGFENMELQADAMGKYFWAVYGYGWELGAPPDHFLDHVNRAIAKPSTLTATVKAMSTGTGDSWPDEFPQAQWDELAAVASSPGPEPFDFASIGAADSGGYHLGKAIMLTAQPWMGVKDIA